VGSSTLHAALAAGRPVDVAVDSIAADSLGARRIGTIAYDLAVRHGVTSVLVDDEAIVEARLRLWAQYRVAVGHSAPAALAGLPQVSSGAGERVVVVLCGANTDPATLHAETAHAAG